MPALDRVSYRDLAALPSLDEVLAKKAAAKAAKARAAERAELEAMPEPTSPPSDFADQKSSAPNLELVSPTDSIPHTVSVPGIVPVSPHVLLPRPSQDPAGGPTQPTRERRPQPRPARLAQDGHSLAEQSVYAALWEAGVLLPDGNRTVTIGLGRLSKAARISENNCRLNIRSLVKKLALDEIGAENSRAGIGKTYRVYSYSAILERRRAAGMEWVIRTKGVAFVDRDGRDLASSISVSSPPTDSIPPTIPVPGIVSIPPHESVGRAGIDSVGGPPTESVPPYRNSFRKSKKETSSSESAELVERIRSTGVSLDDDAARRIIARCRNTDQTASLQEIAHFTEVKIRQLAKRRNIENWPGLLIASVPAYFDPPATEVARYRAGKAEEVAESQRLAREIVDDSQASADDREWARGILASNR